MHLSRSETARVWCIVSVFIFFAALAATSSAAPPRAARSTNAVPPATWDAKRQGAFVVSACCDLKGRIWAGTEDKGVWCWGPSQRAAAEVQVPSPRPKAAEQLPILPKQKAADDVDPKSANSTAPPASQGWGWTNYTRQSTAGQPEKMGTGTSPNASSSRVARTGSEPVPVFSGLGDDNAYALCCDKLGRIWVGHLNHGVSVFDGKHWRNYDILAGPLGERVFAIKTCPVDGDVWIATSAGLTRYRVDADAWTYYTRADGLPSDQIQCLAFDKSGTLYAGTQCDGLAICVPTRSAAAGLQYKTWRVLAALAGLQDRPPPVPMGEGLPTNLLNDVLAARDGTIYVATTTGLALSRDKGRTWKFLRGWNWQAKAQGLYQPPPKERIAAAAAMARGRTLLSEDYVTCLAEDGDGYLWIGHRQKGCEVFDPRTGKCLGNAGPAAGRNSPAGDFASTLLSYPGGLLVGAYGAGLTCLPNPPATGASRAAGPSPARAEGTDSTAVAALPSAASPPMASELDAMRNEWTKAAPTHKRQPVVISIEDDWRTQGDWLGRYGRYWACLSAICSPNDYLWGAGWEPVHYAAQIGPHHTKGDSIRYWVHWLYTTNPRSLEMPPTYLHSRVVKGLTTWIQNRRQAEWDDHGEAYPMTHEGPDLYCTLKIPEGRYFLSLYDFNKDGHNGANRFRDYQVSIRLHDPNVALSDIGAFERQPELARARVRDFWGGVWKRFLVQGPTQITIRVSRAYSYNAILAGVMLDLVDEEPPPYFASLKEWKSKPAGRVKPSSAARGGSPESSSGAAAAPNAVSRLIDGLEDMKGQNRTQWALCSRRCCLAALRCGLQSQGDDAGASQPQDLQLPPKLKGTCQYHCNLFPDWEQGQIARGLSPARSVEKALRWDQRTFSFSGRGYGVLNTALKANLR